MKDVKILIRGKNHLSGRVRISGAKNAALPELAAIILSSSPFCFSNVPEVEDIKILFEALENIGAEGEFESNAIRIALPRLKSGLIPKTIVETTRASILMLGPLIARDGNAKVSLPGGCPIGDRKIDYHLEGLRRMGVEIEIRQGHIIAKAARLKGIEYEFPSKSVTGTEHLLMAASLSEGTTILKNCALEPEIGDLIDLLLKMGADIKGKNSEILVIEGKTSLAGAVHEVIPDRIEMGTFAIAGGFPGNDILIENIKPEYLTSLFDIFELIGVNVDLDQKGIQVNSNGKIFPANVETAPYPGFPTDLQAQLTTILTQANGLSSIKENIFNNRFKHTKELNKLGANIKVEGDTAIIKGKTDLKGNNIQSTDLRASAALVLGGLIAEGETVIANSYQLLRGYENMPAKLQKLGANIKLVRE